MPEGPAITYAPQSLLSESVFPHIPSVFLSVQVFSKTGCTNGTAQDPQISECTQDLRELRSLWFGGILQVRHSVWWTHEGMSFVEADSGRRQKK